MSNTPATTSSRLPPIISASIRLMRLDKPIGTFLVLWPTLWALWLAAEGFPSISTLYIFVFGAILMRSAGCVINDYADRHIDGRVSRTADRPLATGEASPRFALSLFVGLVAVAAILVMLVNWLTVVTAVGALAITALYPYAKRHTHVPQVVLGAAFAWSIPMAFTAVTESLPKPMWTLYIAVVVWTVACDTFYAMVDRKDDLRIGVKSTAILFAENDRMITGLLQCFTLLVLLTVGASFKLQWPFYSSLLVAAALFGYQQYLIRDREPSQCFRAFLNNNWVGMVIFIGILVNYWLYPVVEAGATAG